MGCSLNPLTAAVVAVMAISSCSSSGESDPTTTSRPVESAPANPGNGTQAAFGASTEVGDLTVTVSAPAFGSDADGPWLSIAVSAANASPSDVKSPQFGLYCSGNPLAGAMMATSTYDSEKSVASLSSNEGTLTLLVPGDDRLGQPRPVCAAPATLVATTLKFDNAGASPPKRVRVEWAIPDGLVDQLNSA